MPMLTVPIPTADIQDLQTQASREEKKEWSKAGGKVKEGVWYGPNDKPCLPRALFPHYAKLTHGKDHVSKGGMFKSIAAHWYTRGFTSYSQKCCEPCVICATNNVGRGIKISPGAHPEPLRPFEHIQMDFIELTPSEGKKYCLVMVDMFSKWVEVFPTAKQDASAVTKALLTEIIPRWGIPEKSSSDNGTPFVNQALKQVGEYLGIDLRQHCAYHPASGGAVERENATLKNKLAKCCDEMGIPWTKALPVVLMYMRTRVRGRANLSPFEILFGRPPNTGIGPKPVARTLTSHCEDEMLRYCPKLSAILSHVQAQVKEALPRPAEGKLYDLQPGNWIVVKDFRRKSWRAKRWLGPFQVLLVMQTAIKLGHSEERPRTKQEKTKAGKEKRREDAATVFHCCIQHYGIHVVARGREPPYPHSTGRKCFPSTVYPEASRVASFQFQKLKNQEKEKEEDRQQ
ncbi:protein NYNRIN-like [Scyliorhinus canicula]|uniref:protein NYNRIN-like n=1 Tax=Scyliorhinus canicula TaxID=7830 RepID=UPI0018F75BB9|nr:protein NYNRIN-like [Scyliorhinus canicula]